MACNRVTEIITTAVEFVSNQLVYTIPTDSLKKLDAYNIIFSQDIPTSSTIGAPVIITDGTTNYNVETRKGLTLTVADIIRRDGIRVWFSGDKFILRHFINRIN